MLPQFLSGSYRRYKEETNAFMKWLSQAATSCGYEPETPAVPVKGTKPARAPGRPAPAKVVAGGRLKGKARKAAKPTGSAPKTAEKATPSEPVVKYNVTTQDLLRQAEVVASATKRVDIPEAILRIVESVVKARERCAAWFQETGAERDALDGHQHFIDILKLALGILRPVTVDKPAPTGDEGSDSKSEVSGTEKLSNRFAALAVQDIDDNAEDLFEAAELSTPQKQTAAKGKVSDGDYELEVETSWEYIFDIFCFFEDLHRIEDFLEKTWQSYKDGALDLCPAAMTTNAAIALVRQSEENLMAGFPNSHRTEKRSYEDLTELMVYAHTHESEIFKAETSPLRSTEIKPFDRFLYLPTARILSKFEQLSSMKVAYPQPVAPIRMQYVYIQDRLDNPEVKEWEREDEFLSQYLMDLTVYEMIKRAAKERTNTDPPMNDEITDALCKLKDAGEIKVWNVFAARILYDIKKILSDKISKPYHELNVLGHSAIELLGFQFLPDGAVCPGGGAGNGERWQTEDVDQVNRTYQIVEYWIKHNVQPKMKEMYLAEKAPAQPNFHTFDSMSENLKAQVMDQLKASGLNFKMPTKEMQKQAQEFGLGAIPPAKDNAFLFTQNPVYCGTVAFNTTINLEKAGITLADHQCSVYLAAHLYNAVRQLGLLDERWALMDRLCEVQRMGFFGGDPPRTPKEFQTRLLLKLGFSIKNFAHNKRGQGGMGGGVMSRLAKGKTGAPETSCNEISKVFLDATDKPDMMTRVLPRLETMVKGNMFSDAAVKKKLDRYSLTPLEFLTSVQETFSSRIDDVKIDYLSLTRLCNRILRHIRARCHSEYGCIYRSTSPTSKDVLLPFMVMAIFKDQSEAQDMTEELFRNENLLHTPGIKATAWVYQEFLKGEKEGNNKIAKEEPIDTTGMPGQLEGTCLDCLLESPNHRHR